MKLKHVGKMLVTFVSFGVISSTALACGASDDFEQTETIVTSVEDTTENSTGVSDLTEDTLADSTEVVIIETKIKDCGQTFREIIEEYCNEYAEQDFAKETPVKYYRIGNYYEPRKNKTDVPSFWITISFIPENPDYTATEDAELLPDLHLSGFDDDPVYIAKYSMNLALQDGYWVISDKHPYVESDYVVVDSDWTYPTHETISGEALNDLSTLDLITQIVYDPKFLMIDLYDTADAVFENLGKDIEALGVLATREDAVAAIDEWLDRIEEFLDDEVEMEAAEFSLPYRVRPYFEQDSE